MQLFSIFISGTLLLVAAVVRAAPGYYDGYGRVNGSALYSRRYREYSAPVADGNYNLNDYYNNYNGYDAGYGAGNGYGYGYGDGYYGRGYYGEEYHPYRHHHYRNSRRAYGYYGNDASSIYGRRGQKK